MFQKPIIVPLLVSALISACVGSTGGGGDTDSSTFTISTKEGDLQQTLACNQGTVDKVCNLRIYQIMTESFIDGDSNHDYNVGYGTSHHRGDLQGIINSLDYIQSLGMNAIWFTPVFNSIERDFQDIWEDRLDATGYFTSNYFEIDPKFGTLQQARELVEAAHARGIYVFFDGVFGHHKGNVVPSPMGRIPSNGADQAWGNEAIYPDDLEFYKEVAAFWVTELKIDGWRLDQAYQVPVQYWDDIRASVEQASLAISYTSSEGELVNPLGYMVAEIWRDSFSISREAYGTENSPALNSAFAFPMRYSLVQTLAVEESGFGNPDVSRLDSGYHTQQNYPPHAKPNLMITNHDLVRFGDLLQRGRLAQPDEDEYWLRHKMALSFQAAYSGPITLYYGEEIGDEVEGFDQKITNNCASIGVCDDHVARNSGYIEGVATTVNDSPAVLNSRQSDLKNYVTDLMVLRAGHAALSSGSRTHIYSTAGLYIDRKDAADDHVLYMLNVNNREIQINIQPDAIGSEGELVNLFDNSTVSQLNGQYQLSLPAQSSAFYAIKKSSW